MTPRPDRPEELLREMRSPVVPVESPEAAHALRERTVAHLRGLQARSVVRRELRGTWRIRALVAAAILLPSGALAMSQVPWAHAVLGIAPATTAAALAEASREPHRERARHPRAVPHASETLPAAPAPNAAFAAAEPAKARPGSSAPPAAPPAERSTLSEENRLMQAALAAARAGDDARAIRWLNELLSRYPTSPLVQNAKVERFRALARTGATGPAATKAREYLSEHPNGMASEEARNIAAQPRRDGTGNARFP